MEDTFKDSLANTNKKSIPSFFSINEKQEESSDLSSDESKLDNKLMSDNNSKNKFLKFIDFPKNVCVGNNNNSLPKLSLFNTKSSKSFSQTTKDKETKNNNNEEINNKKSFKKENNNKKSSIHKRISFKNNLNLNILKQLKSNMLFEQRRDSSAKNLYLSPQIKKKVIFKGKQSLNLIPLDNPLNNNNINNAYNLFDSIPSQVE